MNIVQANECVIEARVFGSFVPVLCAKRISVETVTGTQEITNEVDGFFKSYDYKDLDWTVSLELVHILQDDTNPVAFDFLERQLQFLETDIRIIFRGTAGGLKVFNGTVIVARGNSEMAPNELAGSSITLQGSGPYTLEDVLPETVNLTLIMTGDDAAVALAKFRLINTDGEIIFQTDTLPQASGSNLANPFNFVVPIPKGSFYYYFQVNSNLVLNNFSLDAPPTKSSNFNDGIVNEQSYPTQLYDFTADRTVTFTLGVDNPPPTCVPPAIPGSPALPDGTVGSAWATSFAISGSSPFNLTNITKPSWMTIALYTPDSGVSNYVLFQGIPDTAGTGIVVSVDINNACGTVPFSDTIDIAAPPATDSVVTYDFDQFDQYGTGTFRLYVNAVLVVDEANFTDGTINVSEGDTIEAQVLGHAGDVIKNLKVELSTPPTTLYDETGVSNKFFSWVAAASSTYFVTASTEAVI